MHYCPQCGNPNADDSATCSQCGAALGSLCPACGQLLLPGSKFCGHCGSRLAELPSSAPSQPDLDRLLRGLRAQMPATLAQKLGAAAPQIAGERREVTVLLLNAGELAQASEKLDSEEAYLLTDEVMRHLATVVYGHEGTIDKYTLDGLVALFGIPLAHENDPERAVRAALEMQLALEPLCQRLQQQHGLDLRPSIGINTGQVLVGQLRSDHQVGYTVLGNTMDLAERLKKAAQPGTVLVSFATYQRTRPLFEYETLPSIGSEADERSITGFSPLRLRPRPGRLRGLPGPQVAMVGRQESLAQLQAMWSAVMQDRHRAYIVFLTGEAGVGKSRLIAEFSRSLPADISIYQGNCLGHVHANPLSLLADMLRNIIQVSETDSVDVQRKALTERLARLSLAKDEALPHLLDVLALGHKNGDAEAQLRNVDATVRQQLTHMALRQILLAEARLVPTVLIFEDLHWIDPASRSFLEHFIQSLDDLPLMVCLVARDTERDATIAPLLAIAKRHRDEVVEIQLKPLSEPETQRLVDQLLSPTAEEMFSLKQRIVKRAEGNPFYAEEIIRMLLDEGGLSRSDGAFQSTATADRVLAEVPGTLNGLIQARLDRLPEATREVAKVAAVLGPVFPYRLLRNLVDCGERSLAASLHTLESRLILLPQSSDPEPNYAFRHALVQESAYASLLRGDRLKLHDRVAHALEQEQLWPPDEQTEALAHHYALGSQPSQALPYLAAAGDNAARRCANETAIQHFRHALELMAGRDDPDVELKLHVQVGLGQALKFVGEYDEANRTLKAALTYLLQPEVLGRSPSAIELWVNGLRELADIQVREGALGEAIAYLQAGLDLLGDEGHHTHPHLWRLVIDRLAWVRFRQGDLDEAMALANSGILSLDPAGTTSSMTLASLYNTLGGIAWQNGNLSEAAGYVQHSLELYGQVGYLWGMANGYSNLGVLSFRLGNWQEAQQSWDNALAIRRGIGDAPHEAVTLSNLGLLHLSRGEHELAQKSFAAGLAIGRRLGENGVIAHSLASLGQLATIQSRFEEAQRLAEDALALSEQLGSTDIQIQARWILALALAETESVEVGLDSARQALHLAREAGLHDAEADCLRVLGMLRARTGQWLEAETYFRESIEVCLQQADPYRRGLALLELGGTYHRLAQAGDLTGAGWQERALEVLQEAANEFARLGAAYDLRTAQTLLAEIQAQKAAKAPVVLPEGEWRTAAVAWINLQIPPDIDEEVAFETMAQAVAAIVTIAEEYQGRVIQRRDGATLVFGAPVAFEDDAERAVQAASHCVQHVTGADRERVVPLTCRVAVSHGSVVAGLVGPRFHSEFVARGRPVDEAQRLAQSAPPSVVWVTESVRATTEHLFEYQPASPSDAKRLGEPLLYSLVGLRERPAPTRGLVGMEAKFIGRESALQAMTKVADNLRQGLGGVIWIEGEPGIGKSRLMREFTTTMSVEPPLIWRGRCTPHRSSHAFSLFTDLFGHALSIQPTDSAEQIRARIDEQMDSWPRDAQAVRPHLEALLGIQPGGFAGERLASLQPEQLQRQIFVAMRRLFRSLSAARPLVLIMDDLHWLDPVSAELLLFLLTSVTSAPILFVCAQRRQGSDLPNDRLIRTLSLIASQALQLRLERLSLIESEMLLAELLSQAELPHRLTSAIVQRSEGNPYFIEEYVRMLIDQGHLHRQQGRWEVDPDVNLEDLPLPSSLDTLIRSRIDALPPELRQVVQLAAVVGSPFEARLLGAIPRLGDAYSILSRLESRLIIHPAGEAGRWQFNHSLIETIAYKAMLKTRRQALHLEVAEAMKARWPGAEAEHAESLAYHYTQAGKGAKALSYLLLAGERAAARYANQEARAFFEQAAQQLTALPDAAVDLRWRVAAGLGDVYRDLGQYGEAKAALEAGLALAGKGYLPSEIEVGLCRRLGETTRKLGELDSAHQHLTHALDLLGRPASREAQAEAARILTNLAWVHFQQGQFDQALEWCQSSLDYAERASALNELASVENLLGGIYYSQSQWAMALQHTTRAMVLREQLGYTWGVASTLSNLGILAQMSGQWSKAWSFFERSLALRQEIGDTEGVANAYNNLGTLARDQGNLDLAEQHLYASLKVAIPFKLGLYVVHANLSLAQVLLWKGQIEVAQAALITAQQEAQVLGAKDALAEIPQVEAQILSAQGALDEAKAKAERAAALAAETGMPALEASAYRVMAAIELQRSAPQAAREALTRAQQILESVTDELLAGRTAALAGEIALQLGQYAQAEQDLRAARETFIRLGASRDLGQVRITLQLLPRPDTTDLLKSL